MRRSFQGFCAVAVCAIAGAVLGAVPGQNSTASAFRYSAERLQAIDAAIAAGLDYVPGEVLVKFKSGVDASSQTRALRVLRAPVEAADVEWQADYAVVRTRGDNDSEHAAFLLRSQPEVQWAQPNYLYETNQVTPNDPSYGRQWNLTAIDMPRAWEINRGGNNSVIVAVIDSGVTTVTQDITWQLYDGTAIRPFSIPYRINPDLNSTFTAQRDFVFFGAANAGTVLDMNGHGTHVSGTIAQATNNSIGLAGIAYNVRLMPIKACLGYWDRQIMRSEAGVPGFQPPTGCSFPTDATVQAIRYAADQGAKVINLSLGGPGAAPAYRDALQYAVGRGVFVAIAMGNAFTEGNPTEYPAFYSDIEGVMAVGAVGRGLSRSYYSSTGAHNEIAAPGGDASEDGEAGLIYQTAVDFRDYDEETVVVPRFDRFIDTGSQGTSMATPHVAAFAALLISQGITSPAAVEAAIKQFARDLGAAGRDNDYGYGLIQPVATLRGLGLAK